FAGFFAGDQVRRVLLHAVVHLAAGRANVGVHVFAFLREDAGDADALALERSVRRDDFERLRRADALVAQLVEQRARLRGEQIRDDAVDHLRPEAANRVDVLAHLRFIPGQEPLERVRFFRELFRRDLPDLRNAEPAQQAIERAPARILYGVPYIFRALF